MASSQAKKFSLLLLLTLLSYTRTQARDSQLFSKVSAVATAVPDQEPHLNNNQQQEPNFVQPENENGYGLYGHESGQLPPSASGTALLTTESKAPLRRNYNPEAYVTEPEGYTSDSNPYTENSYPNNLKNYYRDSEESYNNQQEDEETASEPELYRYNNNYQYYGGSSFNSEAQGLRDTRLSGRDAAKKSRENYLYNGGAESGLQPQGMSDTRSLENGKYFYDINTEKYSNNHPYAVLNRANTDYIERIYYGTSENSMRESYQNQYEFQDEGNMP